MNPSSLPRPRLLSLRDADPRQNSSELIFGAHAGHHRDMLELLIVVGRALALGSAEIENWFWRTWPCGSS